MTACKDVKAVATMASFLATLLQQGEPELVASAVEQGLVASLVELLRSTTSNAVALQAAECLRVLLCGCERAHTQVAEHQGMRLLVDLLGPPPRTVCEHEAAHRTSKLQQPSSSWRGKAPDSSPAQNEG